MASAVVNTLGLVAPEGFLDLAPSSADCSSYGWSAQSLLRLQLLRRRRGHGGGEPVEGSASLEEGGADRRRRETGRRTILLIVVGGGDWLEESIREVAEAFLHRNRKASSIDPSLNLPLLGDSELESVSLSSRLSLSSSSPSAPDHEDVPRLSLDSEKSTRIPNSLGRIPPRVRLSSKPRTGVDVSPAPAPAPGGRIGTSPMRRMPGETVPVPADSPRMNSSGKVVFHNLERSTSSPSTFNGDRG
ncbi:unnamed protein product [Spirodela intermedia]|uniref:Uncharacterized protein n=1 Tax=Spirodela intermedia TaxID=51605 RepID=A0A7I8JEI4_SPIIN|nr:unnamed protein product [Spirodela intermedia]CAA6668556.1 unnamed protein product [Spirodela intermedia]